MMGLADLLQFALALAFVLALIGLAAVAARRFGLGGALPRAAGRRRLAIVEVLPLDGRRRLVLLRRDGAEQLVILGANGETGIEAGIAAPARFDATLEAIQALPATGAGSG